MTDPRAQLEFSAMDYVGLLWRRRKLFVVPFVLVTVAGLGVGSLIPKGYESKTITKVIERRYLDRLYKGLDVAPPPSIELNTAKFEFRSKETVAEILDEQGLLAHCRTELERQEVIDRVRDKIEVNVVTPKIGGGDKLLIVSFTGTSPAEAQILVKRITEKNINRLKMRYRESVRLTRDKAIEEYQRADQSYNEDQDLLQEFEEQHLDSLMGGDSPLMERTIERDQEKLDGIITDIMRLEGKIKSLEFTRNGLEPELIDHDRVKNPDYESLAAEVLALRAELEELWARMQPDHPIVRQKEEVYRKRKAKLDQTPRYLRDEEIRKPNPRWEKVNIELQEAEAERDHLQNAKVKLSEKLQYARERLKSLPLIRKEHDNLVARVERANEEFKDFAKKRQQVETTYTRVINTLDDLFIPIERASKPLKHSTPPPVLILLISLALGIAAGVGVVFVVEMSRKTFHTPEDVGALLKWPVVGVVHTILSRRDQRLRVRKRAAAVVATLIIAIGISTVVYIYNRNPDLLPDFLVDSVQKFRDLV